MIKYSLKNKTEEEIWAYIYDEDNHVFGEDDRLWTVLMSNFNNETWGWADMWYLDDTEQYLVTVNSYGEYYIFILNTFEEAQKWAIETLQTKANFKVDLTKFQN